MSGRVQRRRTRVPSIKRDRRTAMAKRKVAAAKPKKIAKRIVKTVRPMTNRPAQMKADPKVTAPYNGGWGGDLWVGFHLRGPVRHRSHGLHDSLCDLLGFCSGHLAFCHRCPPVTLDTGNACPPALHPSRHRPLLFVHGPVLGSWRVDDLIQGRLCPGSSFGCPTSDHRYFAPLYFFEARFVG